MPFRILSEADEELRAARDYYLAVPPPAVGQDLARGLFRAFRSAVALVEDQPRSRPEHRDVPGARYVIMRRFPYLVFYAIDPQDQVVVIAIEHSASDFASRVADRLDALERGE